MKRTPLILSILAVLVAACSLVLTLTGKKANHKPVPADGEEITAEKLHMIDRAEQFLIELGFIEERVRMHGNLARIEVPGPDIPRLASDDIRTAVYEEFKKIGFSYVSLDLKGYRTGSMNEMLNSKK